MRSAELDTESTYDVNLTLNCNHFPGHILSKWFSRFEKDAIFAKKQGFFQQAHMLGEGPTVPVIHHSTLPEHLTLLSLEKPNGIYDYQREAIISLEKKLMLPWVLQTFDKVYYDWLNSNYLICITIGTILFKTKCLPEFC